MHMERIVSDRSDANFDGDAEWGVTPRVVLQDGRLSPALLLVILGLPPVVSL